MSDVKLFQVWYRHSYGTHQNSGKRQLLFQFRQQPGRHVWEWFVEARGWFYGDPTKLYLTNIGSDVFGDAYPIGFPDLSKLAF